RPKAVGADQRATFDSLAALEVQPDAIAQLLEPLALLRREQLDPFLGDAGAEQNLVQVAAMDHAVPEAAEALAKRVASDFEADHLLAGDRVHHHEVVRVDRIALD